MSLSHSCEEERLMRSYTVVLTPEPEVGGFSVFVPALPGCFSQGSSIEDALAHAREAITLYLEDAAAHGEAMPDDITPQLATVKIDAVGARS